MPNPEKLNEDKGDQDEKAGSPESSHLARKAEKHLALQEEFASRAGKPYWKERAERKEEGEKGETEKRREKAETGVRAKILDRIRQKIAEIDRELLSVDWNDKDLRQGIETAAQLSEKEKTAYQKTASALSALSGQEGELFKEEFELVRERGGVMTETDKEVLEEIVKAKQQIAAERAKLAESPEFALYARMAELRTYQEGLQNGFAETPTVRKNMEWLREKWEFGRPSILEGHTGSWKSRLVFGLVRKLYSRDPEYILCGERVGPPEVFGRMQLRVVGASDKRVLEVNRPLSKVL